MRACVRARARACVCVCVCVCARACEREIERGVGDLERHVSWQYAENVKLYSDLFHPGLKEGTWSK